MGSSQSFVVAKHLEQRESGITNEFVGGQVQKALAGFTEEQAKQTVDCL